MAAAERPRYLAELGERCVVNGFWVVPIAPGTKAPPFRGWEGIRATPRLVRKWVGNGQAQAGIGILTASTPAVDLDIPDIALAREMERFVREAVGWAPVRYGRWPKRLMPFRTDAPFRKVQSRVYLDDKGERAKVEVLGDGQQFVGYAVHPDTRHPYKWVGDRGPHDIPRDELTELTEEQARAIVARFEARAEELGWKPATRLALPAPAAAPARDAPAAVRDDDDWSRGADLKGRIGLSEDAMRELLAKIPVYEDYHNWLLVGAATHHEMAHDLAAGLELWLEYSQRCSNYDEAEARAKWDSFRRDTEENPKTARFLLALKKQVATVEAHEAFGEHEAALADAKDFAALEAACEAIRGAELNRGLRNVLAAKLRQAHRRVTDTPLGVRESREMLRYQDPEGEETPDWCEGWVYCMSDNTFYRRDTGATLMPLAFNAAFTREALTRQDRLEGRAQPSVPPADLALHVYRIPTVYGRMYMPAEDDRFSYNGLAYVNTYSDRGVPEVPGEFSPVERRDVARVLAHFVHLFPIERDRALLLSWIAYLVRTQQRPNWAVLLQGVEGDGKTTIVKMVAAMLGAENVRSIDGTLLESAFTSWAEGVLLIAMEEVKLHGHSKYEVLNKLKPFITNSIVQVHRKGKDAYLVPNTAGVMLLTNYRDALPVDENDSRYFMVHSRFQSGADIRAFKVAQPNYYRDLHRAIERSPGAIRKAFLEMELHPEFDPAARAPSSAGHDYAVAVGKSADQEGIEDMLDTSRWPDVTRTLLSSSRLADVLEDAGVAVPQTWAMRRILHDMGFTFLGLAKVNRRRERYWSMVPQEWQREGVFQPERVRAYLARGGL